MNNFSNVKWKKLSYFNKSSSFFTHYYKQESDERSYSSSIWGPTCDGLDCILEDCPLPELRVGHWLFFRDMGAYTMSAASTFNGMPPPQKYYFCEQDHFYFFLLAKLGNQKNYFYIYCHLMLKKFLTGIWFTQRECERAATSRRSRS